MFALVVRGECARVYVCVCAYEREREREREREKREREKERGKFSFQNGSSKQLIPLLFVRLFIF